MRSAFLVRFLPAFLLGAALCGTAAAQAFPDRPLRMVVPFPAGTSTDVAGRRIAEALARELGQQVVIENKAGAGGNIGADFVAKAAPNGYTFLMGTTGNLAVNKSLYRDLPYDPVTDFTPLTLAFLSCNVLVVAGDSPIRTIAELIADARANPGKLSYGSPGSGTAGHLAGEWFKAKTGTDILHVPYKGGNQVLADLMTGRLQLSFEAVGNAIALIQAGKLRPLATTCKDRLAVLPEVPTLLESGVKDFDVRAWAMFVAPARLPEPVAKRLSEALARVLAEPALRDALNATGVIVQTLPPDQSAAFLRDEVAKWGRMVKQAGVTAE